MGLPLVPLLPVLLLYYLLLSQQILPLHLLHKYPTIHRRQFHRRYHSRPHSGSHHLWHSVLPTLWPFEVWNAFSVCASPLFFIFLSASSLLTSVVFSLSFPLNSGVSREWDASRRFSHGLAGWRYDVQKSNTRWNVFDRALSLPHYAPLFPPPPSSAEFKFLMPPEIPSSSSRYLDWSSNVRVVICGGDNKVFWMRVCLFSHLPDPSSLALNVDHSNLCPMSFFPSPFIFRAFAYFLCSTLRCFHIFIHIFFRKSFLLSFSFIFFPLGCLFHVRLDSVRCGGVLDYMSLPYHRLPDYAFSHASYLLT